jgi:branched-subunit amino acid aminotransferase/4-amino-4-deoxychorismate lyase
MTSGSFGGDLMAGPPPTLLPADPADAELAGGDAPAAVVRRRPDSPAAWAALAQQAQDAGADDGVVVDEQGRVLETAVGNLWCLLDGVWTTPPLDGRVLPGIAREILLQGAAAAGLQVAESDCSLGDLHRAQALAVSNAVHGPRPAQLLQGPTAAVQQVDNDLGPVWRAGTTG